MKRFDKGYIYSFLLSDLIGVLAVIFLFFKDFLFDEDTETEHILAALPYIAIGAAVIYLCFVAYRIMYYRTSGYELTEKEIKCNRGVLFRKRSVLDYKRVHAVNKKQNLIHKLFGIAVLTVDSGSTNTSHQAEITIIEKAERVDELLEELNSLKENGVRSAEAPKEVLLSEKDSLYRFTSKKKILYTFINIASTAFLTAVLGIMAIIVIGLCKYILVLDSLGTWGEYLLVSGLITVGAMLMLSVFSFIGCMISFFIGYHDFNITKQGSDIRISFGLLERHTNSFSYDRIKAGKISQGLVQRMLGFASIRVEVIGYTNDSGNNKNAESGVLVPFCKYNEVDEILGRILPHYIPDKKQSRAVSYFPFVSWFALITLAITALLIGVAMVPMLIFHASSAVITAVCLSLAGAGAVVMAVKLLSALFSFKNNGLSVSDGKITAYYGGFIRHITVFMSKNLIGAEDVTTPLRQKAGITSLVMHLKTNALSNEVKVHIQSRELSEELEKLLML